MRRLSGNNECFNCGKNIMWTADIEVGPGQVSIHGDEPRAKIVAIGNHLNGSKKEVLLEAEVKCKHCGVFNKFTLTK